MKLSIRLKDLVNSGLAKANLQLGTLTAARQEAGRIQDLAARGYFEEPAFPIVDSFASFEGTLLVNAYAAHRQDIERLLSYGGEPQRYNPANEYFSPADATVAYLLARSFNPSTWLEIGSGNSTRVVRQAIADGKLQTRLVCVDPRPRIEISAIADEIVPNRVEGLTLRSIVERLDRNDVLFIDSSHKLKAGGDVLYLLLHAVPKLRPGVLVHIHDVFLPYDYPRSWVEEWSWDEQYLVQALLQFDTRLEVLWPGYYVHKCRPDVAAKLDLSQRGQPQSLWLRIS